MSFSKPEKDPPKSKPGPTRNELMLDRVGMKPDGAHAVVELIVQVRADSWGPECTLDQAATQAVESAVSTLKAALTDVKGRPKNHLIKVLGARCVRVICEAKKEH